MESASCRENHHFLRRDKILCVTSIEECAIGTFTAWVQIQACYLRSRSERQDCGIDQTYRSLDAALCV